MDDVWTTAPFEPTITNAAGNMNNQRVVAPSIQFSISAPGASQVRVRWPPHMTGAQAVLTQTPPGASQVSVRKPMSR